MTESNSFDPETYVYQLGGNPEQSREQYARSLQVAIGGYLTELRYYLDAPGQASLQVETRTIEDRYGRTDPVRIDAQDGVHTNIWIGEGETTRHIQLGGEESPTDLATLVQAKDALYAAASMLRRRSQ